MDFHSDALQDIRLQKRKTSGGSCEQLLLLSVDGYVTHFKLIFVLYKIVMMIILIVYV